MLKSPHPLPLIPQKPIVVHNDLDGLLSWLFLRELGYELSGIYDLETLYLKPKTAAKDILAVDLDITHPSIPSIGHHFILFNEPIHLNMNVLFGIKPSSFTKAEAYRYIPTFTSKCPLPTFLFLHYLTNTPLPKTVRKRAWLVYADSLHLSFQQYRRNVSQWLKALGYADLLNELESGQMDKELERIPSFLSTHGFPPSAKKPAPQCKFSPNKFQALLPFIQALTRELGYKRVSKLPQFTPSIVGYRYSLTFDEVTYERLKEKYEAWELFSHGMVFQGHIEVTLLTPLSRERDKELVDRLKYAPWSKFSLTA